MDDAPSHIPPMDGSHRLLTRQDAADVLRCSMWTLDALIKSGRLRAVRLAGAAKRGGRVLIDPSDLRAFVEANKAVPTTAAGVAR